MKPRSSDTDVMPSINLKEFKTFSLVDCVGNSCSCTTVASPKFNLYNYTITVTTRAGVANNLFVRLYLSSHQLLRLRVTSDNVAGKGSNLGPCGFKTIAESLFVCLALIAGTSPRKSISAGREQVPFSMAIGNMELTHVARHCTSVFPSNPRCCAHGNSKIEIRQWNRDRR